MATDKPSARALPGMVAKVVDRNTIVVNRGSDDGLKIGQRFLLYRLSEDSITDPETGLDLGKLEVTKGTGKVIHTQPQMATIQSDRTEPGERTIVRRRRDIPQTSISLWTRLADSGVEEQETTIPSSRMVPFDDAQVGDKVRPI